MSTERMKKRGKIEKNPIETMDCIYYAHLHHLLLDQSENGRKKGINYSRK